MISSSSGGMIPANSGPAPASEGIGDGLSRFYARSPEAPLDAADFEPAATDMLPLCVDLDGTLIRTDTLMEGMIALLGTMRPAAIFGAVTASRSGFKARVAALVPCDPALLPYNETLLDYVRAERAKGRRIVLATAANEAVAERVAAHLGLFDEVVASTATHNLKGSAKAEALVAAVRRLRLRLRRRRARRSRGVAAGGGGDPGQRAARRGGEGPGSGSGRARDRRPAATRRRAAARHAAAPMGQEPAGPRAHLHRERDGQLAQLDWRHPGVRGVLRRRLVDLSGERSARPRRRPGAPAQTPSAIRRRHRAAAGRSGSVGAAAVGRRRGRMAGRDSRHRALLRRDVDQLFAVAQAPAAGGRVRCWPGCTPSG